MPLSDVLENRTLLVAVCEQLVPFMNGEKMCRLTFVLDDLRLDPTGAALYEDDRNWFAEGVEKSRDRAAFWAAELDRLEQLGIRVVASIDSDYPINLRLVHNFPPLLFVRGTLDGADRRAVAVVGTREATADGLQLASEIATDLVTHNYTVVSGLAKGVDTAAHAAALNAGGRTIAVFGTPIEKVYPAANKPLARQITRSGACVSQFLPTVRTGRWSFPARNVTGSGLGLATVVVEAAETSGARLQAEAAVYHGKRVFLVEPLVTTQPWAQQMAESSSTVVVVDSAELIIKELEADLAVGPDAVFA